MASCAVASPAKGAVPSAVAATARANLTAMAFIGISRCSTCAMGREAPPRDLVWWWQTGALSCKPHHRLRIGEPPHTDKFPEAQGPLGTLPQAQSCTRCCALPRARAHPPRSAAASAGRGAAGIGSRPFLPQPGDDLLGHGHDLFVLVTVGHEDDSIDAGGQMGLELLHALLHRSDDGAF